MRTTTRAAPAVPVLERRDEFHLVLIKPTHYDDDGYPIQWVRSAIPSNTLACLNGLATDARRRCVLGPDVNSRSTHSTKPTSGCSRARSSGW
jgi:hypothetical protein